MSEWRELTVEEIAARDRHSVVGGPFGSSLGRKDYLPDGVPVIRGAQLSGDGTFSHDGLVFVSEEKADRHLGNIAFPGDVLVTQRGTVGQVGWIPISAPYPRYLLSQSQMKLAVDTTTADSRFVYYSLKSPECQQEMVGSTISAGVPHINLATFKSLRLRLPSLATQRVIVAVLASLDDLIDNNRRRIELLEQMAQAIYREWFVHFRYPGHEDASLVDSELGPIPDAWELTTCGSALTVLGGGTPSKKEATYWEGGSIPWYTPSDLTKRRTRFAARPATGITEDGLNSSSARLFPAGSVLMTSRATLGVLAISITEATCNQGFIVIPPDDRWPSSFILEWLDHHAEDLEALGTGATFKEITKGAFKHFPFLMPAPRTLDDFREVVVPIDATIASLEASVDQLTSIRDLLLPKLVTGQIDVSELDLDAVVGSVA